MSLSKIIFVGMISIFFLSSCTKGIKISAPKEPDSVATIKVPEDPFFTEEVYLKDSTKRMPTSVSSEKEGEPETYIVEENDTLMLISFKLYGHHREWREIYKLNKEKIADFNNPEEGSKLIYYPPENKLRVPEGLPYLIKNGDTLSLISKEVYRDWRKWTFIWKNNSDQIEDPNIIFAGFTLYYPNLNYVLNQLQ